MEHLRFTDVLTTATSVARLLGAETVEPAHVAMALDVLEGRRGVEDLGRPVSPLVRRAPGGPVVGEGLRDLVQHWWRALGEDVAATLAPTQAERLRNDLAALEARREPGTGTPPA